jgi:hypothetical protein
MIHADKILNIAEKNKIAMWLKHSNKMSIFARGISWNEIDYSN